MSHITLDPEHGVYPIMEVCFFCGETNKGLVLAGRQGRKIAKSLGQQEVRQACFDKEPCDECKKLMEVGVMLIAVSPYSHDVDNPSRTGPMAVIKDEAIERIFDPEAAAAAIKKRAAFVADDAWDLLGLPRENINNMEQEEEK
jgi:hypothetical protein